MKNYTYSGHHKAVIINMKKSGVGFVISVEGITILLFYSKLLFQEWKKIINPLQLLLKSRKRSRWN